jgi:hypothetical protein
LVKKFRKEEIKLRGAWELGCPETSDVRNDRAIEF